MKCTWMYFMCSIVATGVTAGNTDTCKPSPEQNCTLFSLSSNIVTLKDIIDQKVTSDVWVQIYVSDFTTHQEYGKCNVKWHIPDSSNVIRRQLMCYNFDEKKCIDFERNVTRDEDSCGRATEKAVNTTMDAKFYSQDLNKYMWYDSCYAYRENGECATRYLDLLVRDIRYPDAPYELDLKELPWHFISTDLTHSFNLDFSSPVIKFTWKGPECGFDGDVISIGAFMGRVNLIVLCCILAFVYAICE